MKIRIKNIEECTKLFHIEVPEELVKRITEEIYQDIKKVANIPGFRVGSAPRDLLEKHHSKTVEEEVLKRLIPEGYKKALGTHKIVPVGVPQISGINIQKGKPLTFQAQVDVRPNTRLRNYKRIKVRKKRISASEEEVDETLLRLRNMYAKHNDVSRPIKKGDYAVCNVEAYIDGVLITKKNKDMWILADKETSLLGMGEHLLGLEKGQEKEIDATLPENYPDKKYAGKHAKFKVVINEVKEKELPALDDAFAKTMNCENIDTLKKNIESQLFMKKESDLKVSMQNQILERLLRENKFSVPSNLANRQKQALAKSLETELLRKGIRKDEIKKRIKDMDPNLEKDAKDKVCIYFMLDDIAVKEKIEVDDKDLDEKLAAISASTGQPAEGVKEYYEKENLLGGLLEQIKEDKVLDFLLKQADITEEK